MLKSMYLAVILLVAATIALAEAPTRREEGKLVLEGIPEIPVDTSQRLTRYRNVRSASLAGWHPSGKGILITTRFAETPQVHWVQEPGATRRQLTFFDEPVRGVAATPSDLREGFLFRKDVGGSEFYQYYWFDLVSYNWRIVTDGISRNKGAVWANDGNRFAYSTTRRNGRDYDLHVVDMRRPGESVSILEEGGAWFVADWSPDDSKLLVARYVSINETHPYLLDIRSKKLMRFDPGRGRVAYGATRFSKDGKGVYYTSDRDSEYRQLRYHDLASGKNQVLTGHIPWDIGAFALSKDGRYLAFSVNEDGISRLYMRNLRAGKNIKLPKIPVGQVGSLSFHPSDHRLGMVLNTPQTPGDVYSLDIQKRELVRWTYSEAGGLRTDELVVPRLIRYETFDEVDGNPRTIPAFYYEPKGSGPHPVLVDIHGGPESQRRPFFNSRVQYLVNELGVAVLQPNVRGSRGYGKSYLKLDNSFLRENAVKDIGALLDWITKRKELDAERVAVYGGSYGGYMVLASMVHFSDRIRAGIDVVGISNFVTFLENTQPYRRDLRRAEYGDERNPEMREFLLKISPIRRAAEITKPIFIAQGLNDPRVPASESEQMVRIMREAGGTVWYLVAKNEGHGFFKKSNLDIFEAVLSLFLERHLLEDGKHAGPPSSVTLDKGS